MHAPIINSLLDLDFYKLLMARAQWEKHGNARAEFAYHNRTKATNPLDYVDLAELRAKIAHVRQLRFTEEELAWVATNDGLEDPEFIDFLRNLQLPEVHVSIRGGELDIRSTGPWPKVTFWETLILSIVSELFTRGWAAKNGVTLESLYEEGDRRLDAKIALWREHRDTLRGKIIEFGTRRRAGRRWQAHVFDRLLAEVPEVMAGTSNCHLAMNFGVPGIGTHAHEQVQGYAALYGDLDAGRQLGQREMIVDWLETFGPSRAIFLTDTFGSDAFFLQFLEFVPIAAGVRHDSGDPAAFAYRVIEYYRILGLNPLGKRLVFSDGLTAAAIVDLNAEFTSLINDSYGIGTHLTNDLGIPTLSQVMKLVRINGIGTVKLSDNPGKHMGDEDDIRTAYRVYHYRPGAYVQPVV